MNSGANQGDDPQRKPFFRPLATVEKMVVFASLLILFWLIGGFEYSHGYGFSRTSVRFVVGAAVALWLRPEPIGTFRQVSFHGLAVLLGSLLMLWSVVMTLFLREAMSAAKP